MCLGHSRSGAGNNRESCKVQLRPRSSILHCASVRRGQPSPSAPMDGQHVLLNLYKRANQPHRWQDKADGKLPPFQA